MLGANDWEGGLISGGGMGSLDASIMGCRGCGAEPVHSQVIPTAPVASPSGRGDLAALPLVMPSMPLDKPLPVVLPPLNTLVPITIPDPVPPPTPVYTPPDIGVDVINGDIYNPPIPMPPPTVAPMGAQGRLPCC